MPRIAQKKNTGKDPASNSARPLSRDRVSDEHLVAMLRTMPRSTAGMIADAFNADRQLSLEHGQLRDQLRSLEAAGTVACHDVAARRGTPRHFRWWVL